MMFLFLGNTILNLEYIRDISLAKSSMGSGEVLNITPTNGGMWQLFDTESIRCFKEFMAGQQNPSIFTTPEEQ